MGDLEESADVAMNEDEEDLIFKAEEIKIEELAIDGICGVY